MAIVSNAVVVVLDNGVQIVGSDMNIQVNVFLDDGNSYATGTPIPLGSTAGQFDGALNTLVQNTMGQFGDTPASNFKTTVLGGIT